MALELRLNRLQIFFNWIREERHLSQGTNICKMQRHQYPGVFRELPISCSNEIVVKSLKKSNYQGDNSKQFGELKSAEWIYCSHSGKSPEWLVSSTDGWEDLKDVINFLFCFPLLSFSSFPSSPDLPLFSFSFSGSPILTQALSYTEQ